MLVSKLTKKILAIAVLIAIAPVAGAYAQTDDSTTDDSMMMASTPMSGPIAIGGLFPLTGEISSIGIQMQAASDLAVEDFNAYLAEEGAQWWLVMAVEDTATSPVIALEKVQALHARGISNMVGPITSSNTQSIKGYTDSNNMLIISCCSTAPNLAIPGDSIYRLAPDDENQGNALGKILENDGLAAIVPVWRGDAYGDGLREAAALNFESRGGEVHPGVRYAPDTPELSLETDLLAKYVQEMADEHGAENVAVFVIAFDEITRLVQSATQHEILKEVRWYGTESTANAEDLIVDRIASEFVDEVDFTAMQILSSPGPLADHVNESLTEELGSAPNPFAHQAYDAVWILGKAIMEAGSTDSASVKSTLPGVAAVHSGATGSTELNDAGDLLIANYQVVKTQSGAWINTLKYSAEHDILVSVEQPAGDVMIGSLYPLTGRQDATGYDTRDATQLGADDFNDFLRSLNVDWRLDIISEDSATNQNVAFEKVTTLFSRGIDVIIGPRISSNLNAVLNYANTNNIMLISCCSTAPSLAIAGDNAYRLVPDDRNQGTAASKLLEVEGIEVIVPVWRGDAYGDGLQNALKDNFERRGYTTAEGIRYNPDLVDFSSSVSILADRVQETVDEYGADKVAVFLIAFDESVQIMQSAERYDILNEVRWFGAETLTKKTNILNDAIARNLVINTNFMGVQVAEPAGGNAHDRVEAYFVDKNGEVPITLVYHAYDAAWLVGLSILQSGGTDADTIKSVFHEVAANYKGAIGAATLNEAGDLAAADYAVWEVTEDGEWVQTGKYTFEDDSIS